jgi:hypothetical protein
MKLMYTHKNKDHDPSPNYFIYGYCLTNESRPFSFAQTIRLRGLMLVLPHPQPLLVFYGINTQNYSYIFVVIL